MHETVSQVYEKFKTHTELRFLYLPSDRSIFYIYEQGRRFKLIWTAMEPQWNCNVSFCGYSFIHLCNPGTKDVQNNKFSSVQSLSCVWLLATPWTTARQASLYIINSWSLTKLMSIESVMPSNHLTLCRGSTIFRVTLEVFYDFSYLVSSFIKCG